MKQMPSLVRVVACSLTIAAAYLLQGCSKPAAQPEPIRSVKVVTVGAQPLASTLEYAGEVRARVESRLGFRVGGKLLVRPAEVGQHIQAGQLLAQLDPQDLKLAAQAARAQLDAARSNRDLAAADFTRFQALKDQNFISSAELQRRDAARQAAQAQFDSAQAQLSAQANQAAYAALVADAAGVVTAVLAEPGQVVAAGAPVVQLARDGARDVVFAVPEDKVGAIKVGAAVAVRSWLGQATYNASVREVAASAEAVTRTFMVKVALPADAPLALGSTVSVVPAGVQHTGVPVIKLPTSALRQEGQGTAVWVLDATSMTVRSQTIMVATADGNDVVVASGLTPGMQVVTAGVHVLSTGQKVALYKPNQALALTSKAQTAIESVVPGVPGLPASAAGQ